MASLGGNPHSIEPELAREIYYHLSRQEEIESKIRDQWGNWDWQYSRANREGALYRPWLDERIAERFPGIRQQPDRWPDGKPFALCITHDVDWISSIRMSKKELRQWKANLDKGSAYWRQVAKYLMQRRRARGRLDPLWHFENWLELESQYCFRSTFYFFSNPVQQPHHHDCGYQLDDQFVFCGEQVTVAEFARELLRGGWDVGLHGSFNSATDANLLREQKERLEKAIDLEVYSSRQHYLRYDPARTPRIHAEAGFQSDSTQGFNRNIGFRAGTCFPYRCIDLEASEELPVLEIPQHIMDGALFATNSLEYDCDLAVTHSLELMDRAQEMGGVLTISWHPNNLEEVNPLYWRCFAELLREAHQRNAWGCSARQLAEWWTDRRMPSPESA